MKVKHKCKISVMSLLLLCTLKIAHLVFSYWLYGLGFGKVVG